MIFRKPNGEIDKFLVVQSLVGGAITCSQVDGKYNFTFHDDQTPPTEEEINAKIEELVSAEPMRLLRLERNKKLAETDWMSFSDSPTMSTEWQTYRQSLRDLPSTAKPKLDENGKLTNVTWPTKPK